MKKMLAQVVLLALTSTDGISRDETNPASWFTGLASSIQPLNLKPQAAEEGNEIVGLLSWFMVSFA